ncbi:VAV protein, partial [Neopipo cinnamomea]|nr:VAV protein [Neopipo cinnamomea]
QWGSRCPSPTHGGPAAPPPLTGVPLPPQNKSQRPGPDKKRGDLGLPKVEATQPYSGVPPPPGVLGPPLRLSPGDVVEVTAAQAEELWWQVGGTRDPRGGDGTPGVGVGPPRWGW